MGVVPKEPFSLWMMLREPGREVQELPAAFGSASVAKLFGRFLCKDLPARFHGRRRPVLTLLLVSLPGCDGRS